jgi:hypothetical protein
MPNKTFDKDISTLSDAQKDILEKFQNTRFSLSLRDTPAEKLYAGCGNGWLEFDENGTPVELSYCSSLNGSVKREQNVYMATPEEITKNGGYLIINNRLRLRMNFSCVDACGF